jgi:Zn-dependent M16 (insulinase) family peptidase
MDKLQYLPLLGKLMLSMGTRKHGYVELTQHIGIHTGGIRASHFSSASLNDRANILSFVFFNGKAVIGKLGELFDLYAELLTEYKFDDPKRLVEIIRSTKADMQDSIIPHGNHYVLSRLQSYHSQLGKYNELTGGITYYKFIENLLERAEKNPEEVACCFKAVAELIFTRENMIVNFTSAGEDYSRISGKINALADLIPDKPCSSATICLDGGPVNEAFVTAGTIQYVGKGANLYDLGFDYTGQFDVLKSILGTVFLWEKVRMQGGAYGSSSSFDRCSGDFSLVSYRDPNLTETLNVYDEIPDFLNNLDFPQEEMTKFIIGCVGHLDPPLSPDRKGMFAMTEHLLGITPEIKQKRRDELLSTTLKDLNAYAPLFEKVREMGKICVLGNEEKIKKSKNIFDHTVKVFS